MREPEKGVNNPVKLELLAPAGNTQIGMDAIDHGADAIYTGAPKFSARASAGNSLDDIRRLIDYAHLFRVRVYIALNTILSDSEINEARKIIDDIYDAGADGLILQDTGLLESGFLEPGFLESGLLEKDLPPLPLFASTQMHNSTPEKVRFLERAGFSRVILARELSLQEIREIRSCTEVELESFVHGALCVSYSGQCYLSHAAFGRSGNRGVCAQPCRLKYTLKDGKGRDIISKKHLLSLKDLNLVSHVKDLVEAGVTSFKIEGRYKDAAYVRNVVAAYRQAIDSFIESHRGYVKQSSGDVEFQFTPDLNRTFNRGYTTYFLNSPEGRTQQAAMDTPKSIGAEVGTVTEKSKKWFRVSGEALHNGDGLCFISRSGLLKGFRVDRVEGDMVFPNEMEGIEKGLKLYRNHDHIFLKNFDKTSAQRRVGLSMWFGQSESEIWLQATDEDGFSVKVTAEAPYQEARNPEKVRIQIKTQLESTGNTIFRVTDFSIDCESPGFLQISILNGIRRDALEQLTKLRSEGYQKRLNDRVPAPAEENPYPEKRLDYRANVMNSHAKRFYERHGAEVVELAFEREKGITDESRALMTTRYCIRRELGACLKDGKRAKMKLEEPLTITDGKRSYRLQFDCRSCRMLLIADNSK